MSGALDVLRASLTNLQDVERVSAATTAEPPAPVQSPPSPTPTSDDPATVSIAERQRLWAAHLRRVAGSARPLADRLKAPRTADRTIAVDPRHHQDLIALLPLSHELVADATGALAAVRWMQVPKSAAIESIDAYTLQLMKLNAACSQRSQLLGVRRREIADRLQASGN
ncbi:hypothetical protein HK405_012111 [Cladochytrium tenue]|nr:hypothetical protein HK405_012111 [Cladochytrium tenue]